MSLFFYVFSDEDNERILGQWMEEILSPSENKDTEPRESTPPRFDGETGGGKRSRKTSAGEGQSLPDKRESDSVSSWHNNVPVLPAVLVTLYIVYCA